MAKILIRFESLTPETCHDLTVYVDLLPGDTVADVIQRGIDWFTQQEIERPDFQKYLAAKGGGGPCDISNYVPDIAENIDFG